MVVVVVFGLGFGDDGAWTCCLCLLRSGPEDLDLPACTHRAEQTSAAWGICQKKMDEVAVLCTFLGLRSRLQPRRNNGLERLYRMG